MNIEDIKVGETYNVRVRVNQIDTNRFVCQPLNQDGTPSDFCPNYFNFAEAEAFYPISPANGIKNTETAPKYDPCRLLRKGDKVKLVARDGRSYIDYDPTTKLREGAFYTVLEDELDVIGGGCPDIRIADEHAEYEVLFYFLELVTPVEELEPYSVSENIHGWVVFKDTPGNVVANFNNTHPHAKAAAVAERDRLNAEHRKDQDNG